MCMAEGERADRFQHGGVELPPRNIIDKEGTDGVIAAPDDFGMIRIHADALLRKGFPDTSERPFEPSPFFSGGDHLSAGTRRRGAEIEDVGAALEHLPDPALQRLSAGNPAGSIE